LLHSLKVQNWEYNAEISGISPLDCLVIESCAFIDAGIAGVMDLSVYIDIPIKANCLVAQHNPTFFGKISYQ